MIDVSGTNKCHYCSNEIDWRAIVQVNNFEVYTSGNVNAEAIAIASVLSTNGKKTEYEVTVTCPTCGVKNKYHTIG